MVVLPLILLLSTSQQADVDENHSVKRNTSQQVVNDYGYHTVDFLDDEYKVPLTTTVKPHIVATEKVNNYQQEKQEESPATLVFRLRRSFRQQCFPERVKKCKVFKVKEITKKFCVYVTQQVCYALDN